MVSMAILASSPAVEYGPSLLISSTSRIVSVGGMVQILGGATYTDSKNASNPNPIDWSTFLSGGVSEKFGGGAGTVQFDSQYGAGRIVFSAHTDANCSRDDLTVDASGTARVVQDTSFRVSRISVWSLSSTLSGVYTQNAGASATVELYEGGRLIYNALSDADETVSFKLRPFAQYRLRITASASASLYGDYSKETSAAGTGDGLVTFAPYAS